MLQRPIQEPTGEGVEVSRLGPAIAQMSLDGLQMVLTGLGSYPIVSEHIGLDTELVGNKRHGCGWGTAEVIWDEAHEAQRTELQGIAETVMRSARARYALVISDREGKKMTRLIRDHRGSDRAGPVRLR